MAMVKCRDCGNDVSDRATNCPKCGGPMAPAPAQTAPREYSLANGAKWAAGLLGTAFLLSLCTGGSGTNTTGSSGATSKSKIMSESESLAMCQVALTRLAKDPEKAQVPYVRNQGTSSEHYFAWGANTKMMRMRNGLGLEVAVSGSCIVDPTSRRITSLTMDGKTVL